MNHNFKTIALAAGFDSAELDDPKVEKFADLIVKTCTNVIQDAVDRREPASTYVGKIRQQFYHDPDESFDRMVRGRCEALAIAMMGRESANVWWITPNDAFNGSKPIHESPREVYTYLMSITGKKP